MTISIKRESSGDITNGVSTPSFSVDAWDPLAQFVRQRLGWDWLQVLLAAIVIYGLVEKFIVPIVGGYLNLGTDIWNWAPDVVALLTGFIVYPLILAFYIWTSRGIGELFVTLWRNQCFSDIDSYLIFVKRAENIFNRPIWTVVSLGFSIFIVLLVHLVLWGPPPTGFPPWFGVTNIAHRLLALSLTAIVGYAFGQILIRQAVAVYLLSQLLRQMGQKLVIHPYHVDGAGGLGILGEYAVRFSFVLLAVVIYFISGSFFANLQSSHELALSLRNPALILAWVAYVVLAPGTIFALVMPAHFAMIAARNAQLDPISAQLDEQLKAAESSSSGDRSKLPDILKEIENLKSMRALILEDYPTWPISADIRRQISFSTLLPPAIQFIISIGLTVFHV